ncbi:MAG TPA: HAD family hydrolase [Acidimicrobiales bacterium]|nr:HAD family hydrolase [Acidimicrobiales bacterium]
MKPPVRLIATDIDGTLIMRGGEASTRTVAAIRAADSAGVAVVLVTGRPPRTARLIAEALGVHGPAVCADGALVVDLASLRVIRDVRIAGHTASNIVVELTAAIPGIVFAWERGLEWGHDDAWPLAALGRVARTLPGGIIGPVGLQAATGLSKLICHVGGADPDSVVRLVGQVLAGRAEVTTATSPPLAEVTRKGCDKREALEWLCQRMGINRHEVLAIGDGPNDLPMLLWAGRGIAMGNAHTTVLEAVSERARTQEQDGFAAVIETLLGIPPPEVATSAAD